MEQKDLPVCPREKLEEQRRVEAPMASLYKLEKYHKVPSHLSLPLFFSHHSPWRMHDYGPGENPASLSNPSLRGPEV